MALVSTKLNVAYSMGGTSPKFVFTDVTDYSAQGAGSITGVIQVTAPSGIVYTGGSPDITVSTSRINSTTILIPLLANGSPEVGNYSFKYTATDGTNTVTYTVGYNFQYVSPTGILTPTVDCLSPRLTSTDATNYLSGSTTPSDQFTITVADASANTFTIAGEKSGLFLVGDTFNVIGSPGSPNNDGNYTVTSVKISTTGINTVIGVANVGNPTPGGSISTKTNTIYYPPTLALTPVVGYESVVSTNTFYSQTQSFKVSTKSFYDFGNGISVINTVSATSELDVDCDVRLCEVFCCVNSTLKAYLAYRGVNDVLANQELNKYILATSHLSALRQAFECGYDKEVNSIVKEIITVTQCTPDCSCSDTTPQPITGLGTSSITVVNSSDGKVVVSSNTSGNTTTYSLSLSQAVLDSITAATATSSVVSSNGSVTITSSIVSGNTAYNLSVPVTPAPVEFMSFKLSKTGGNSVALSVDNQVIQNVSNLKTPTVTNTSGPQNYNAYELTISGFQNTANNTFKIHTQDCYQQLFSEAGTSIDSTSDLYTTKVISPVIVKTTTGSVRVRFFNYSGRRATGLIKNDEMEFYRINININIYE